MTTKFEIRDRVYFEADSREGDILAIMSRANKPICYLVDFNDGRTARFEVWLNEKDLRKVD